MIIKFKQDINDRAHLAKFVANCMGDSLGGFEPYKINSTNDTEWTVDRGNDWWVIFNDEKLSEMKINHRYRNTVALENLMRWISFRTNSEIIEG